MVEPPTAQRIPPSPTSALAEENGTPNPPTSTNPVPSSLQLYPVDPTLAKDDGRLVSAESENEAKDESITSAVSVETLENEYGGQFTFRSAIIGSLFGCLVAASNFYLGLKVGWTFGAQLFAAICTFGVLKPLTKAMGGYFGPKEK